MLIYDVAQVTGIHYVAYNLTKKHIFPISQPLFSDILQPLSPASRDFLKSCHDKSPVGSWGKTFQYRNNETLYVWENDRNNNCATSDLIKVNELQHQLFVVLNSFYSIFYYIYYLNIENSNKDSSSIARILLLETKHLHKAQKTVHCTRFRNPFMCSSFLVCSCESFHLSHKHAHFSL